jgi:hypothetical protein
MILVRDVFQLKFGKAKEARALWKEGAVLLRKAGFTSLRVLTDLVGTYYTMMVESQYKSLSDYENAMQNESDSAEWRSFYPKFAALVESGKREIFNIEEI